VAPAVKDEKMKGSQSDEGDKKSKKKNKRNKPKWGLVARSTEQLLSLQDAGEGDEEL
jgi:hypothetical protein